MVVPYNPWLLRQFDCHINVELCMSIKAIKYVIKYTTKGSDRIEFSLKDDKDEISNYMNTRYVGAIEATWRLLGNHITYSNPTVISL